MTELDVKEQFKRFLLMKYGPRKEREFWKMMHAPQSPLYRKCYEQLNPSEQKNPQGSEAFQVCMRRVFDQLTEIVVPDNGPESEDQEEFM